MKLLKNIFLEDQFHGVAVIQDPKTKEETIITMPAERYQKFIRKFKFLLGRRVEVANGWIYPLDTQP
jgi:hypothetical protein